eukprot:TRINITY_DN78449_c0_g1_i2.p3 TRINITY_DN78449_c0_g1~~TRINITY_DN78449_c0_g1_i2.p3  ORF type:complete len:133 (-),score=23.11 TRINITY_DN78449_c0_g1_i2:46-444(-)
MAKMSEQTGTDATSSMPTPVAPNEAKLGEGQKPRLTLTHGAGSKHAEEEFDALADLFLGDDEGSTTLTQATRRSPEEARPPAVNLEAPPIEGLILGHLPVSASSWVKTVTSAFTMENNKKKEEKKSKRRTKQ